MVGNLVYTLDRQKPPDERERILCFAAETGKLVWKHDYSVEYGKLDYATARAQRRRFMTASSTPFGAMGDFRCLDAKTGKIVWN